MARVESDARLEFHGREFWPSIGDIIDVHVRLDVDGGINFINAFRFLLVVGDRRQSRVALRVA